jgi:hypothetical protein
VTRNDPPKPTPTLPAHRKVNTAVLLITAAVFVTVPLLAFAALYLWLNQTSFASVDEVKPAELESVQLQLLNLPRGPQNRPDPAPGERLADEENTVAQADQDIGPVKLSRPDFEVILQPLLNAQPLEASQWPACPFLGEIKVRFKDGRPGTIRLYWAPERPGDADSPARVYMKVGSNRYRACPLKELRTFAQACADRGTKVGR